MKRDTLKKRIGQVGGFLKFYLDTEMIVYAGYAAFFILLASIPLLMLVATVVGMLPSFDTSRVMRIVLSLVPDLVEIKSMVREVVENVQHESSGFLISVAALTTLWSASMGLAAVRRALQKITLGSTSNILDRLSEVGYTAVFLVLIVALLAFGFFDEESANMLEAINPNLRDVARIVVRSHVLTLIFAFLFVTAMYCYLPGGKRSFVKQMPGAAFTIVGWIVFTWVFSLLVSTFWASSFFGSFAAVFLLASWLNIVMMILLAGAAFNQLRFIRDFPEDLSELSEKGLRVVEDARRAFGLDDPARSGGGETREQEGAGEGEGDVRDGDSEDAQGRADEHDDAHEQD